MPEGTPWREDGGECFAPLPGGSTEVIVREDRSARKEDWRHAPVEKRSRRMRQGVQRREGKVLRLKRFPRKGNNDDQERNKQKHGPPRARFVE